MSTEPATVPSPPARPPGDTTRLLTAEEVASRLGVQASWVSKAARANLTLLCPLCAREQFANTGLLVGIVASKMRRALKGTESTLGGDARLVLDEGFEQLRLVEHALGRLGAESDP